MFKQSLLASAAAIGLASSAATAHTFECRIVERIGFTDHVLGDTIIVRPGSTHRYRIQFRVIPDNEQDAIAGMISWYEGTLNITGGINTRTAQPPNPTPRGRLYPWGLAGPQGDGQPLVDPFTSLTAIDAAISATFFYLPWGCTPEGVPEPRPIPTTFGRNEFVSFFDFTSVATPTTYTVTVGGSLNTASQYADGNCRVPPLCGDPLDPSDDDPVVCILAPIPQTTRGFSYTFTVRVCVAERNDDREIDSQDFFAYLNDFFAGNADLNNDGQTTSADFFIYIAAFLNEC